MAVWASRVRVPAALGWEPTVVIAQAEHPAAAAAAAWAAKVAKRQRPEAVVVVAPTLGNQEIRLLDQPEAPAAGPLAATVATVLPW
jgi:hypothetical protein